LDYPPGRLEIILVDHDSRDRTGELLAAFCARHNHAHMVRVQDGTTALSGKAAAVAAGIERSQGEIVLMTDADCVVPPSWVRTMVSCFAPEVGVVCGFTVVGGDESHFAQAQALDWLFLLSAAAGAGWWGVPLTWVGNNLAFRRSAYDQIGGYRGVGFSLTEDFALFKAICSRRSWQVRFVRCPEALVQTQALRRWRQVFAQRLRWAIGGRSVALPGKVLLALAGGARLILLPIIVATAYQPLAATLLISVLLTDFVLLCSTCRPLKCAKLLKAFFFFEALFASYVALGALTLPFVRVLHWKGVSYPLRPSMRHAKLASRVHPAARPLAAVKQESWS
jgi:cellulose synthase/poly-beta-1,6-N-acetylglucosamine synthase-like glycosyltransferase